MMNLNGNDEIQLTDISGFKGGDEPPQVSPDGSTITFSSYQIIEGEMIVDIYLVNVDGSNLTNLTHGSINGFMPKFQPNRK